MESPRIAQSKAPVIVQSARKRVLAVPEKVLETKELVKAICAGSKVLGGRGKAGKSVACLRSADADARSVWKGITI